MNHLVVALIVFLCLFSSALLGWSLRDRLPAHHLSDESISTAVAVLMMCALSTSAAILLVEELNRPLDGLIGVSLDPMRDTLSRLGQ